MARKIDTRTKSQARRDRSLDATRAADTRELDDQERLDIFRQSLFTSILPNLPKIKGYHVCWLTTANVSDTIQSRLQLGYELIKPSDIPGFPGVESLSPKTGEYAGCIGVKEMVAAKLPLRLYQMYMEEAHHHAPLREEQKLEDALDAMEEQMRRTAKRGKRIRVEHEEGMEELVADRPPPRFAKMTGER